MDFNILKTALLTRLQNKYNEVQDDHRSALSKHALNVAFKTIKSELEQYQTDNDFDTEQLQNFDNGFYDRQSHSVFDLYFLSEIVIENRPDWSEIAKQAVSYAPFNILWDKVNGYNDMNVKHDDPIYHGLHQTFELLDALVYDELGYWMQIFVECLKKPN